MKTEVELTSPALDHNKRGTTEEEEEETEEGPPPPPPPPPSSPPPPPPPSPLTVVTPPFEVGGHRLSAVLVVTPVECVATDRGVAVVGGRLASFSGRQRHFLTP